MGGPLYLLNADSSKAQSFFSILLIAFRTPVLLEFRVLRTVWNMRNLSTDIKYSGIFTFIGFTQFNFIYSCSGLTLLSYILRFSWFSLLGQEKNSLSSYLKYNIFICLKYNRARLG